MSTKKNFLACLWGAAAFYSLCYGIAYKSANALLLFAEITPLLAVFVWWMVDRAALERRITRLEARSEIADERRLATLTNLAGFEHRLVQTERRVECVHGPDKTGGSAEHILVSRPLAVPD
jgi:hypothetical protein